LDINPGEVADTAVDNAKQKADEAKETVENFGPDALKAVLSAFDNLLPKEPKNNSKMAHPIIAAIVFNCLSLILLFVYSDNYKIINISIIALLMTSLFLNIGSFFVTFSLFSVLFNVIGDIPGIGDNSTGAAIYLSGLSFVFLLTAFTIFLLSYNNHYQ